MKVVKLNCVNGDYKLKVNPGKKVKKFIEDKTLVVSLDPDRVRVRSESKSIYEKKERG